MIENRYPTSPSLKVLGSQPTPSWNPFYHDFLSILFHVDVQIMWARMGLPITGSNYVGENGTSNHTAVPRFSQHWELE